MADARLRLALAGCLAAGAFGCGSAQGSSTPPSPTAAPRASVHAAPAQPELPDQGWAPVASSRYSIELLLPERESWFVDDRTTQWFVARHAATRSEIVARVWRATRRVRREECETQARLWRPAVPKTTDESVMERREIAAPEGFSSEMVVGVAPLPASSELQGYAVAFGATVGRCYALVYTTIAAGPGADAALGRRLAIVADQIVPRVRVRSIDERVH